MNSIDASGLESIFEGASDVRHEIKFFARGDLISIQDLLGLFGFKTSYPPRRVYNLYWDTPFLTHYWHHLGGLHSRLKIRMRGYGSDSRSLSQIELKARRGEIIVKRVFPQNEGISIHSNPFLRFRNVAVPEPLQVYFRSLQPSLFNSFLRHYYLANDGHFRATIDSHLKFSHPDQRLNHYNKNGILVEFKFAPDQNANARRVLGSLPFRYHSTSKYIMGIQLIRNLLGFDYSPNSAVKFLDDSCRVDNPRMVSG